VTKEKVRQEKEISTPIQDYLKAIYQLEHMAVARGSVPGAGARSEGDESQNKPTTSAIAERLQHADASVTNMLKRLADMKLVQHTPYHGVTLTPEGKQLALKVLRQHRLLELYLYKVLGLSLEKVHGEAEKLEHVLSDELEEKMDEALHHPTIDPHGDPIPDRKGMFREEPSTTLSDLGVGKVGVIRRLKGSEPGMLEYLEKLGLVRNATVTMVSKTPSMFAG